MPPAIHQLPGAFFIKNVFLLVNDLSVVIRLLFPVLQSLEERKHVMNSARHKPDGRNNADDAWNDQNRYQKINAPPLLAPWGDAVPDNNQEELCGEHISEREDEYRPGNNFVASGVFRINSCQLAEQSERVPGKTLLLKRALAVAVCAAVQKLIQIERAVGRYTRRFPVSWR